MAAVKTYNPKDCVITVGGVYITGLGEEMCIRDSCYGMFKIKRGNIEMHEFVLVWVFLILYLARDLFK